MGGWSLGYRGTVSSRSAFMLPSRLAFLRGVQSSCLRPREALHSVCVAPASMARGSQAGPASLSLSNSAPPPHPGEETGRLALLPAFFREQQQLRPCSTVPGGPSESSPGHLEGKSCYKNTARPCDEHFYLQI